MIRVFSHDPAWFDRFEAEASRIEHVLAEACVRIHHIGSTAIPQTKAKPIIDLLLEISSLDALDRKAQMLIALGYEAMGEFGIPGRRYFRLDDSNGMRKYQIHAFEAGVPDIVRHVAFRDYMRANFLAAEEYGALKERLARAHPDDMAAYIDGKDAFVKEHERRALRWTRTTGAQPLA